MRIDEGIINQFILADFTQAGINRKGIKLFYRKHGSGVDVIVMFYSIYGNEMSVEEYRLLIAGIKTKFLTAGYLDVNLLGIILTDFPEKARRYFLEQENHWMIDLAGRRLIIYEDQVPDYAGLKDRIESLLIDDSYNNYIDKIPETKAMDYSGTNQTGRGQTVRHVRTRWVSLCNSILIAANIIVFLLVNITAAFGEPDKVEMAGALSWFFLKDDGEYYRIITSMFLHYDLGHLFNNMLVLFFVGDNLERAAGKWRFLVIYFSSGIIAGITSISYNMIIEENVVSVGASGAIFGVVGAMIYIIIVNRGRLEGISSHQLILFAIFSLYSGIVSVNIDNAAHIGGFLAGIIVAMILYRKPKKNTLAGGADES